MTDSYRAQTSGPLPQNLVIASAPARPGEVETAGATAAPKLYKNDHQVSGVPEGVDTRINDCIVCFPADSGLVPQYISFATETSGRGVVLGQGAQATSDWWKHAGQGAGASIPVQVGNVYRYREFASIESFDNTTWRAIAADALLIEQFDDINRKRMARGFAPYAPKSSWVGNRREFEFRLGKAANDAGAFFDLDQLRITQPNSQHGLVRRVPSYAPWPVTDNSTWTPLLPPGAESLGPTELPATQQPTTHYPGATIEPVELQNESHPAVDPGEVNASIPGYGEDDDLPSPGLVSSKPGGDHHYYPKPDTLVAFPGAKRARSKTPVQGGGGQRQRWKDPDGTIYEWDSQHGTVEKYNRRGRHLGEFDHLTGAELKPGNTKRRIEP